MAYTNNPYCTLQDVKDAMALKSSASDAWISSLIVQAQAYIDRKVGYSFQSDGTPDIPSVRNFSGHNTEVLFTGWIQQLVSVQQTSTGQSFNDFLFINQSTLDITADCYIGPDNTIPGFEIRRLSGFPFFDGRKNYVISGVWGFGSIPPEISRACARIAVHWYKMRDTNYADTLNEQGSIRQKYSKQLPDDVVEILEEYRLHSFYGFD